jgi:Protein O-mannosyl-transferase TMEM260-like
VKENLSASPSWSSLGLPLGARRNTWIAAGVVFVYYLITMSRGLSFYDSPELALVASEGGLGHPLGQPLHTLIGWIFSHLPGVSGLVGLNLLSALAAALTVVPLVSIAEALCKPHGAPSQTSEPPSPACFRPEVILPAGVGLLALQPALWENATRIEVYSLATLLATWAVAQAAPIFAKPDLRQPWGWFAVGVSLGLAASVNALIALSAALALAPVFAVTAYQRRLRLWDVLRGLGGGLVGLVPFLYIPLVAGRTDVFVWGAPTGGEALRRYLTNADFVHNQGITAAQMADNLSRWVLWAGNHLLLPLVVVGLVSHVFLGRRSGLGRGFAALAFGLGLLMLVQNVIFWPSIPDYLGYLALSVGVLGAGACAGVVRLAALGGRFRWLALALSVALLPGAVLAYPAIYERKRHADQLARTMATGALKTAPESAILLVRSDHWVFPLLYLHRAEGLRPDVVILPVGLSGASWYWNLLHQHHTDLRRFKLRGPGGRLGRIKRFLAANSRRPILYEHYGLAMGLGRQPGCPGAWLLGDRQACVGSFNRVGDQAADALAKHMRSVGEGSPPGAAVAARISLERGELLWRLGFGEAALNVLRAGVPPAYLPALGRLDLTRAGRLRDPPLRWKKKVLIGHWSRNLFLAARLLYAAGHNEAARAHLRAAARGDLPEARSK